jgi:2-oxoglutarate ferredoxin oxidoreductase subunit beta
MTEYYQSRVYDLAGHDTADFEKACAKAREWDYNRDAPIALGVFYERALPTFDDRYPARDMSVVERSRRIRDLFEMSE